LGLSQINHDQTLTGRGHALLEVSLLYSGRKKVVTAITYLAAGFRQWLEDTRTLFTGFQHQTLNHETTLDSTRIAAPQ
jgi:hypothetical protein